MLIASRDRVAPGVGFAVVADGPGTSRPLTLLGLTDRLNMRPTLAAALTLVGDDAAPT